MIEGQEGVTWDDWVSLARTAEDSGLEGLFRSDHYDSVAGAGERGSLDAWATLAALAAVTERLRLGTMVSPVTFRHPAVVARMVVTADHVSGGRIDAGLGAGWDEREHAAFGFPYGTFAERFERYAEQLEIVHGLWSDGPFDFDGRFYRLEHVDAHPKPLQRPLPFVVGGWAKPKTVALAARYADEYNAIFSTPDEVRAQRATVADAWTAAGRDPATLRFSVMTGLVAGRDEDELARRRRRLADERGRSELPEGWIVGTPDVALERLRAYRAAGCARLMLQLMLHDELDQIALIGELASELS